MSEPRVLPFSEAPTIDRGGGIYSNLLVVEATGSRVFCSGMTSFPPGASVALHTHNADEQVTILEGQGMAEIAGRQQQINRYDTTFIPAGVPHRLINFGRGSMRILWVYGSVHVTRTDAETGEETDEFERLPED